MGPNRWPADCPIERRGRTIFFSHSGLWQPASAFVRARPRLAPDHFLPLFAALARGSLLYYPPQSPAMGPDQFGVSAHTDYGALTLVCQERSAACKFATAGDWVTRAAARGSFIVNIGDLMARWTNDVFVSTPHRVEQKRPGALFDCVFP
jgi:hypothetical protein